MKKVALICAFSVLAGVSTLSAHRTPDKAPNAATPMKDDDEKEEQTYIKAIRLINTEDGKCTFEVGKIPTKTHLDVNYFFGQTKVDDYEKRPHAAPRTQYVVTLKGKLRFKVSSGKTFVIEPGVILIAEDVKGTGHSWDLVEGKKWERLYIPFTPGSDDHFIPDKVVMASNK